MRVTGLINQELLLKNEYFRADNRILRALPACLRLSDPEKSALAQIGEAARAQGAEAGGLRGKPDVIDTGSSTRKTFDPNTAAIPADPDGLRFEFALFDDVQLVLADMFTAELLKHRFS